MAVPTAVAASGCQQRVGWVPAAGLSPKPEMSHIQFKAFLPQLSVRIKD
jgi:hypothetical protein